MIQILFEKVGQRVGVEVRGENVVFFDYQSMLKSPIDGMKLSYEGVLLEHPDLENNPNWRAIAITRFKEHVRNLETEDKRCQYIVDELKKIGYKPLFKQKEGFRIEKLK